LAASRLSFSPRRASVPVFIVTQGAQITRLAGALADGVLLANTAHAPVLRRMLGNLAAGAERAGRGLEELEIGLRLETCLSEDRASAMTLMKQRFVARLLARRETADLEQLGLEPSEEFLQVWASEAADRTQRLAALLPDEAVSRSMLAGSTDEAVRSLAAALESEVGQVTIRPHAHAGQRVEDVITRFAEQVLPLARAARQ
jgi:5,10-methylenetetrahydromethanopterin reductase